MRIRTIKPEYFRHEELFDLEKETGLPMRVAYAGLWCVADREGRFAWRVRTLKSEVLPFDDVDFSRVLDALLTRGFLKKYRCSGEWFGFIPSFRKHQFINPREKESVIPDISDAECVDESSTRDSRVDDACNKERKGKEGKGKDGESVEKESAHARQPPIPSLDECLNEASMRGVTLDCARWFWYTFEATGWVLKGSPITNWRALLQRQNVSWRRMQSAHPSSPDSLSAKQVEDLERLIRTKVNDLPRMDARSATEAQAEIDSAREKLRKHFATFGAPQ